MDPITTENTNAQLKAPKHLEGVVEVPAEIYPQPAGNVVVFAVWDFTDEEREEIAAGAKIKVALNVPNIDVVPLHDMRVVHEAALVEETPEDADGPDADGDAEEQPLASVTKLHLPGRDF